MLEDKEIDSMRFFPYWNKQNGTMVRGLIELMYDIGIMSNHRELTGVEIGCHRGESALIISSFPFIKKLTCVDLYCAKYTREKAPFPIFFNILKSFPIIL